MRKELKIRPGFTPQEDVGRFRGSRQQASDAGRAAIPGSTRTRPPPENPFAASSGSKTKAQVKNEKRREKKKAGGVSNKAWDESDDESDDGDIGEAFKAEAESRKAANGSKSGGLEKTKEDEEKPAWPVEDGGQGMVSEAGPDGGGVPDEPIPIEPAVGEKKDRDEGETAIISPPPPGPTERDPAAPSARPTPTPSTPEWRTSSSRKPKPVKPHPIQGGRQGPIGLAHPPPIEQPSKSSRPPRQKKPSNTGEQGRKAPASSAEQAKSKQEPRVRKEIKVRDTGLGSLADRVKNLVIANQEPEQKTKKERPATKSEPAAAA